MPGVTDVYASSAFQVAEVTFDPDIGKVKQKSPRHSEKPVIWVNSLVIARSRETCGLPMNGDGTFFRRTEVYEQTKETIGFAQNVSYVGRPLWPCPGIGVINTVEEEN